MAVPPISPPAGTGHHQQFSARNAIDLGIVRELIECGLSLRRIRSVLAGCRNEPYYERDQRDAIARHVEGYQLSRPPDISYDFLVVYRDPRARGHRFVGRASGEGVRWWREPKPKQFIHEFVDKKSLADRATKGRSLVVVNIAAIRRVVYEHFE